MTVAQFLDWGEEQPDRWELFDGVPIAMAPERLVHGRTKARVFRALDRAIREAGVLCESVLDSVGVQIDRHSSYQPDVLVYCGTTLPGDDRLVESPLIVVEVLSPSNAMKDLRDKLIGYFKVESVVHYLIIDPDKPIVIHHRRAEGDSISTRVLSNGNLLLEPPGLTLQIADLFEPPEPETVASKAVT